MKRASCWDILKQEVIKFNILKRIFNKNFMEWNEYKAKVDFLEFFYWQQGVHRQSIRNI